MSVESLPLLTRPKVSTLNGWDLLITKSAKLRFEDPSLCDEAFVKRVKADIRRRCSRPIAPLRIAPEPKPHKYLPSKTYPGTGCWSYGLFIEGPKNGVWGYWDENIQLIMLVCNQDTPGYIPPETISAYRDYCMPLEIESEED